MNNALSIGFDQFNQLNIVNFFQIYLHVNIHSCVE